MRQRDRTVAYGLALGAFAVALARVVVLNAQRPNLLASDLVKGYLPGAQRFLETGSPYEPYQLAGGWALGFHTFIHPPSALPLFLPFLALPVVLWWIIPAAVTVAALWRLRPAPWAWVVIALCLCWPRSTGSILAGNSDIWATAAVAAGAAWGWPLLLLTIKPTFAPLALVGVRQRSAWLALVPLAIFMALTAPLWVQWWTVVRNADLSFAYSLLNVPLVAIGVVAWASDRYRARASRAPEGVEQWTTYPA